jgi:hypothetical protein
VQVGWAQQGGVGQRVLGVDRYRQALQQHRPLGQPGRPGLAEVLDAAEAGVDLAVLQRRQGGGEAAAHAQLDPQLGGLVDQPADHAHWGLDVTPDIDPQRPGCRLGGLDGGVGGVQELAGVGQEAVAGAGQLHSSGAPDEQRLADGSFELADPLGGPVG